MEMNNMENWSYDDFDKSISSNESEISRLKDETSRLREANKKLREVKSRKMMADSLSMITDNGIDFSLADLQAFLQSKKNNAALHLKLPMLKLLLKIKKLKRKFLNLICQERLKRSNKKILKSMLMNF